MSSFVRRLQRQVSPSDAIHIRKDLEGKPLRNDKGKILLHRNPPRSVFYMRRGDKLGVGNQNGRELVARRAREERKARQCAD